MNPSPRLCASAVKSEAKPAIQGRIYEQVIHRIGTIGGMSLLTSPTYGLILRKLSGGMRWPRPPICGEQWGPAVRLLPAQIWPVSPIYKSGQYRPYKGAELTMSVDPLA